MLAGPGMPPVAELAGLGVRRISVGSGPTRAAMGLVRRMGRELLEEGIYASITRARSPTRRPIVYSPGSKGSDVDSSTYYE